MWPRRSSRRLKSSRPPPPALRPEISLPSDSLSFIAALGSVVSGHEKKPAVFGGLEYHSTNDLEDPPHGETTTRSTTTTETGVSTFAAKHSPDMAHILCINGGFVKPEISKFLPCFWKSLRKSPQSPPFFRRKSMQIQVYFQKTRRRMGRIRGNPTHNTVSTRNSGSSRGEAAVAAVSLHDLLDLTQARIRNVEVPVRIRGNAYRRLNFCLRRGPSTSPPPAEPARVLIDSRPGGSS